MENSDSGSGSEYTDDGESVDNEIDLKKETDAISLEKIDDHPLPSYNDKLNKYPVMQQQHVISLEKYSEHDNPTPTPTPMELPPQQFYEEPRIRSKPKFTPVKVEKPKKVKKPCKIKKSTRSLLILIFGFICPLIWLLGLFYIKSYNSKANRYALVSIILFAVVTCIAATVVPIVVVYIKNGGFACNNCTYTDDYDYDYGYDY